MNAILPTFEHLHPEYRARAAESDNSRIEWIRTDRWIPYPQAEKVLFHLSDLLAYPPRGRMPCLLLYGHTGIGKSKIIEKYMRENPPLRNTGTGKTSMPVVAFQMPSEPTESLFYLELLRAMETPISTHNGVSSLRNFSRRMLQEMGTRMLIIDEIHALLSGTPRAQRLFLNEIRFLANDLRLSMVCLGTQEARAAITTDPQLADRFEAFELMPWKSNKILADLLTSFEVTLPLRLPSSLATAQVGRRIIDMTNGITVRILRLIESAAVQAIRTGREMLDEASFTDETLILPLVSMANRIARAAR